MRKFMTQTPQAALEHLPRHLLADLTDRAQFALERSTLADIAVVNGSDPVAGLIDEAMRTHPELVIGFARPIRGQSYKTLVRTSLGNASGSFRNANEGVAAIKHTYENRLVQTYILEARWECDRAVADRHEDGPEAYIALEASGTLEGEMQGICKQFYYGPSSGLGNSKGFPGLVDMYDASNMVVDAGGTTANTGSSAWLVRFGPKDLAWVWGENGALELSDVRIESIADANGNRFDGYVQTLVAYPGLQVGSIWSVCRIKKLTEDSGKGLTDTLIAQAISKFPAGALPDAIFVSRRSLAQLRASRTATNPTGAPAPFPEESFGVPIYVTDAILNTEPLSL